VRTYEGMILAERYRLDRLIATGGMGQVWEGTDQELDRVCAIKVLREEYAGDSSFLERFRAEARHTAALSHESVAALYDYGEIEGRAWIVMEFAPGRALSEIIADHPDGMPEQDVISILIQLARALDAAHAAGVVHRDVKPENLLVDEDLGVKITDFGIARSSDSAKLTKTGLVMGTAQYLSPEQAMGKIATSLSDLYAFGIVAYEMLAGHRPFTGSSQVEIAMAQVKQPVPALPDGVSEPLRALVERCLAKSPARRPRSAARVARYLEAVSRGETPEAEVLGPVAPPKKAGAPSPSNGSGRSRGTRPRPGQGRTVPPPAAGAGAADAGNGSSSPVGTSTAALPMPSTGRASRHQSRSPQRPAAGTTTGKRSHGIGTPAIVLIIVLALVVLGAVLTLTGVLGPGDAGAATAAAAGAVPAAAGTGASVTDSLLDRPNVATSMEPTAQTGPDTEDVMSQ
jgi:eukaryotic-like serine/threonine-protein kinase